ncbi:MAG TPA: LysM peptidoglycan-binding domain-containing protein [Candidatus Ozemobacteraceae bacterium]|nr:LysM peptidoglycan-binding domain-containing protein [Candidatus Ozemobacteraceae bacterium]
MVLHDRRGIVGFMLTVALGVAIGAATLVVGTEVAKGVKEKLSKDGKTTKGAMSDPVVAGAWDSYQKAKKAYDEAVAAKKSDVRQLKEEMDRRRETWKQAVLERTGKTGDSPSTGSRKNPFTGGNVQVEPTGGSKGKAEALPTAPAMNQTSGGSSSGTASDKVSLQYYTVKAGDSLSAICQRYYGDKGMWTHILQYQIPSIAATPNLIFPGQIIALPRNLTTSSTNPSATRTTGTTTPPASTGKYPIEPAGDESWDDTFQKDYVISDHTLTDTNTMTVAQIQSFLDAKGSCLAKPYNGSTPAQMIYNAAKKYGINPQVLLTRLQCEQGLISKKTATQKELDWALGVGCYDSGNWNQNYKGFDKQIEGAAQTYRRHYDKAKAELAKGEKVSMTIDGESVTMKNAATYAFYKYCPHFQGNKLFFDVWRGYKKYWP